MTDLDHKRRQCRAKADSEGKAWVIFVDPADFEPRVLCDCPLGMVPAGMDVIETIYPKVGK